MIDRPGIYGAAGAPANPAAPADPESLSERVRSLRLPAAVRRRSRRWPWAVAVLLIFGGIGAAAYWKWPQIAAALQPAAAPAAAPATSSSSPPATPAAPNSPLAGAIALESKGYIIPAHQILVSPKVSGMITHLNIEEGRRVAKGEVLAEIESIDYQADVARAKAVLAGAKVRLAELQSGNRPEEISQAKAELAEAEAQRDQTYLAWKRAIGLRGTKVQAESEYELAESQYKAMEQRLVKLNNMVSLMVEGPRVEKIDAAKAEVQQAEADLIKAEWRLSNCQIIAPISGTILKKNAEEGNIVNPVAFNGSFSVCEMADLSDLEVDLSIQERDVSRVHQGQKCQVRSEAYPQRMYEGVVSRLMPIADRAKGAVPVRVKLRVPAEEEGVYLKPEMGAVVSFLNSDQPPRAER